MNLSEKKRLILTECFTNVRNKNSLKEQEELQIEFCFFSSEDKNKINERIKNKNLNLKRRFKKR